MSLPSFMENGGKSTPFRMNTRYGGVLSHLRAVLSTGGRASVCPPRPSASLSPSLTGSAAVTDPRTDPLSLNLSAGGSGTCLPLIGLRSWPLSCKPQGQDHTNPRAELYQEAGTCIPLGAWDGPQASQFGGLCGRSGSQLGPIPGSEPRYGLVGVRGLRRAARGWMEVSVRAHTHPNEGALSSPVLSWCPPPDPKAPVSP